MSSPTNSIYEIRQTGVAIGKTASRRGTTASSLSDPQFVAEIDKLRATNGGLNLHWAALLAGLATRLRATNGHGRLVSAGGTGRPGCCAPKPGLPLPIHFTLWIQSRI